MNESLIKFQESRLSEDQITPFFFSKINWMAFKYTNELQVYIYLEPSIQ